MWRSSSVVRLMLLIYLCQLHLCDAVSYSICNATSCWNSSSCVDGTVALTHTAANGGRESECFEVWPGLWSTIACSTTSGVTAYNFWASDNSTCLIQAAKHAWSGQNQQCVEDVDRGYYASVDCNGCKPHAINTDSVWMCIVLPLSLWIWATLA